MIFDFVYRKWRLFGIGSLAATSFLSFDLAACPKGYGDSGKQLMCTAEAGLQINDADLNPSTYIIGKWKMVTVLEGNQDISPTLNPDNDRWIQFNTDGTFESGGGPHGANTGTYRVDNEAKTLHIDSDAGEGDDSNWRIQFREDLLYMRGIGSNRQEMTTVISQRMTE